MCLSYLSIIDPSGIAIIKYPSIEKPGIRLTRKTEW
jgi:hypothetical protein